MHLSSIIAGIATITLASSSVIVVKDQDQGRNDARGACLRSCHQQRPACPENMDPSKLGECWSCCFRQQSRPQGARLWSPAVPEFDLDRDGFERDGFDRDDFEDEDSVFL
ncbi:uncharacterized protein DSM5745_05450 [Aspergillus mulundensis]|uniref:Uncharacterized protein n=1 Tax=Aspergillus mulundensis TaxID=1810919 RepID=A0A3D8RX66_9EURO|nr:hypothetical protein DSM5745_05450 [Aspergillus mulundensis]RDW78598.1 hypothetical protein DSM5745_05450 [Aspergillus mulundensis]